MDICPVKDIEDCIKGKNKFDSYSRRILAQDVASYLYGYQYNPKDKAAVCELLNFPIKNIFIAWQKNRITSEE